MVFLEDLRPGLLVSGIHPDCLVTIIEVKRHGSTCVEITYKDTDGRLGNQLLYRENEASLALASDHLPWSFDADSSLFRLISEAYRISLAYLFDPLLAVHTSLIEPLPHQITAVYEIMLARQPLRYLLADDPGAGKTIMTGLLIKELFMRGDLRRCLIVAPGNLVEQWQDELRQKFHLTFEVLTNDRLEASATGNALVEIPFCIARLDKLARDEGIRAKLEQTEWDLVVVDEAHKMSATFFGSEIKYTRRYQVGQVLGKVTRHLLLLSATPHNGKEEDFQLFLRLLDPDRFEGHFSPGESHKEAGDLMRHLVKEQLYTFQGTPLFPERRAYTVSYSLSGWEEKLYNDVTEYVRQEFNRVDALENKGRKGTVGFALTTLQRRLASSPEAIYQSLRRRRERLVHRLAIVKEKQARRTSTTNMQLELFSDLSELSETDLEDLEDAPVAELEEIENQVVDQASAARTISELEAEIQTLVRLEELALSVRRSGADRKWEELSNLLQNRKEMFDEYGHRLKLVIFTEHRDTLNYLTLRIRTLLGREDAVATIHGGISRSERARAQEEFTQNPDVVILLATDAAGEGINLQRAHLMVCYDMPWNPNRLEQRFGRIHRIGQKEVCHLWNLVAIDTREGEVYHTLLRKLEEEREALGGQVFDVLGDLLFENHSLRDLMLEAIRYGDRPEIRSRLTQVVTDALDRQHLQNLLQQRALTHEVMDVARVYQIREEMERAATRRLQPHFIAAFFLESFKYLGGKCYEREPRRYEITYIPAVIRNHLVKKNSRAIISRRYERVVFEKQLIHQIDKPDAALLCPGHPLLDAIIAVLLEQSRTVLKQGAILVDPQAQEEDVRVLFYVEHTIQDANFTDSGRRREISQHLQFLEITADGKVHLAGPAPFLDYRALRNEERAILSHLHEFPWLERNLEQHINSYAISELVPHHLRDVRQRREKQIERTEAAVNERLTAEISYWDNRAVELQEQEAAGKPNARLNSKLAAQRRDELYDRLQRRKQELERERQISPLPPNIVGGALILSQGVLNKLLQFPSVPEEKTIPFAHETQYIEQRAMATVMEIERHQGYTPRDVSTEKCGYDIESAHPYTGELRFIEVKGRRADADTITVTKNEILVSLNKPEHFILAVVLVNGKASTTYYIERPFQHEIDFEACSVNYNLSRLLKKATLQFLD